MPQQSILNEYNVLVDKYQAELELQRDFRKLSYESIASEMFFNGDLGDSANIDILHDLDLAHYVLFGSTIDYPDRSGGEPVSLASVEEEPTPEKAPEDEVVEGHAQCRKHQSLCLLRR